ncbi:hypothetical protein LPJ69_006741, partial [Coemansia sp. RSA 1752]
RFIIMAAKHRSLSTMVVAHAKKAYFRYELMTGIYILDTWEKHVFNVLAFVILVFVVRMGVASIPPSLISATQTLQTLL